MKNMFSYAGTYYDDERTGETTYVANPNIVENENATEKDVAAAFQFAKQKGANTASVTIEPYDMTPVAKATLSYLAKKAAPLTSYRRGVMQFDFQL